MDDYLKGCKDYREYGRSLTKNRGTKIALRLT